MKTKIEIIKETYEYYKTHRQAFNKVGGCSYLTKEGDMCAVGRCMTDEIIAFQKEHMDKGVGACKTNFNGFRFGFPIDDSVTLDQFLKPEYHRHSAEFWRELQMFHDNNKWVNHKINPSGQAHYEMLLERWKDEE